MAESKAVVIDNGSWSIKAGFASDDAPKVIFPTLVGRQGSNVTLGKPNVEDYLGMDISCPVKEGMIDNWDDMTSLWNYVYGTSLGVDPSTRNVLVTDSPTNTPANREKMAQILFEQLNVPGLYIGRQAVLSLYSTGRMTGIVLDSGHTVTHAVPIYEGFTVKNIEKLSLGGKDVTDFLAKKLGDKLNNSKMPFYDASKTKEALCRLRQTKSDSSPVPDASYQLPDGSSITVGEDALLSPEILFNTRILDPESDKSGIADLIMSVIQKCEIDTRASFLSNIILSGGSTLYPNFAERVTSDVKALAGQGEPKVRVIAMTGRQTYTWIGGSIVASLDTMTPNWVTKAEYKDEGPAVIARKCN